MGLVSISILVPDAMAGSGESGVIRDAHETRVEQTRAPDAAGMTRRWGWGDAAVAAALALSAVLLWKLRLMDPATQPYRLMGSNGDLYTQIYPMALRGAAWIRAGQMPLWNPFQYCGHPFLATGIYGVLYPFNFPYLILPTALAMEVVSVLHLGAAGVFMYAFARGIDLGRAAAAMSGVTFMFSGYMVMQSLWFMPSVCAAAWLPLALLAIERIVGGAGKGAVAWSVVLGATIALAFLAGWPQIWLYAMYAIAAYATMRLVVALGSPTERPHVGKAVGLLILAAMVGVGLMAGQLLPGLELQGLGPRRAGGLSLDQTLVLGGPTWLTWMLQEAVRSDPGEPPMVAFGMAAFLLIPLSLLARRFRARAVYFWVLLLFSTGVAADAESPLFTLYRALPGLSWFRAPLRILYLQTFAAAALCGIGMEILTARRADGTSGARLSATAIAIAILIALFSIVPIGGRGRVFLLLGGILIAAALWTTPPRARIAITAALLATVWWNLFSNTRNDLLHPYNDPVAFDAEQGVFDFIKANQGYARTYFLASLPTPALMAKQGSLREIYSITDYEPLSLWRYARFFRLLESAKTRRPDVFPFTGLLTADPTEPTFGLIDLMSVRYIVAPKRESGFRRALLPHHPSWFVSPASAFGRKVFVLENRDVLPRAFVAHGVVRAADGEAALAAIAAPGFDPRRTVVLEDAPPLEPTGTTSAPFEPARIVRYDPSSVVIETTATTAGHLVLTDTFYPGWTATVDGEDAPILQANYLFRAVPVAAGRHVVRFAYAPRSFALGISITIATLVVVVVMLTAPLSRVARRWRRGEPSTQREARRVADERTG